MAKLIASEQIPTELLDRVNTVKSRILFLSPSVTSGSEKEAKKDDFEALTTSCIGSGGFGKVYKVKHKVSQNVYAIKVVSKSKIIKSNLCEQIRLEVRIMYSLHHEHILKLFNHFEDDEFFYLVLEYMPNGHLYDKLKTLNKLPDRMAAQYLREVISAVEYLHSLNPPIIHRDIKPENILLDATDSAKLCDFGWSNFFNPDRIRKTYCGTPDYLAPEMIRQQGHDQRLDYWNLGVLLFELLTGKPPFQGVNQHELFENILKLSIKYPRDFSVLARDLVGKMLKSNPNDRIPLTQALEHPWFKANPELRPVITQELKPNKVLPTLEQEIEEDDYEVVSRVSKVNQEGAKGKGAPTVAVKEEQLKGFEAKKRDEKDVLLDELSNKVKTTERELRESKAQLQAKNKEVERAIKENEDIKQHLGMSDKGVESPLAVENKRLAEELLKLKLVNRNREELIAEVEKQNAALEEARVRLKAQENECDLLREAKRSLESKLRDLQMKFETAEKKYESTKQSVEQTLLAKEKKQAELEAKIEELQYKVISASSTDHSGDGSEAAIVEATDICKRELVHIRTYLQTHFNYKNSYETVQAELTAVQVRFNELKAKHETQLQESQRALVKAVEEATLQCEKEKRMELEQKEKKITELRLRIVALQGQNEKVDADRGSKKTREKELAQLQKTNNEMRLLNELSNKERKYLNDKLKATSDRVQDLERSLEKTKEILENAKQGPP